MANCKNPDRDRKACPGADQDTSGEFDPDCSPTGSPTTPLAFNGSPGRRSSCARSQSLINGRIQKPSVARSQSFNGIKCTKPVHRSHHMETLQAQLLLMKATRVDQKKFAEVLEKLKDMHHSRSEQQQQHEDHSAVRKPSMRSSPLSSNQTFPRVEDRPAEASTIVLLQNKFAQLKRYKESIQGQQIQVYPNHNFRSGHSSAHTTPTSSTASSPCVRVEDSYYFDEGTAALLALQQEMMSNSALSKAANSGMSEEDLLSSKDAMGMHRSSLNSQESMGTYWSPLHSQSESMGSYRSPLRLQSESTTPYSSPLHSQSESTTPYRSPLHSQSESTTPYRSPLHSQSESTGPYRSPLHSQSDRSPLHSQSESTTPYRSPLHSHSESTGAYRSPLHSHSESTTAYRSPLHSQSESTGRYRSPLHSQSESTGRYRSPLHSQSESSWSACESPDISESMSPQGDKAANALLHYMLQPPAVGRPPHSTLTTFKNMSLRDGPEAMGSAAAPGSTTANTEVSLETLFAAGSGSTAPEEVSLETLLAAERTEILMAKKAAAAAEMNNVGAETKLASSIQQVVARFPFNLAAKFSSPKSKQQGAWGKGLSLNTPIVPPTAVLGPADGTWKSDLSFESSQAYRSNESDVQWYNNSGRECSNDLHVRQQELIDTSLHL